MYITITFDTRSTSRYFSQKNRGSLDFVLSDKFRRKKLVLYEDERMILDQLCEGKVYQKEVEGFSENTVYRKLKAARERNGNVTREQLVDAYRNEKENASQE